MSRANDPAIKAALLYLRSLNIQNPEYSEIKRILENGVDGRYADYGECADCNEAMTPAYNDGTMPGFFHARCEKHRK
jgi:hypothetical protein